MVTSNRFKVPRISVLVSMVGVFLLSMVSFQGKAQTCVFGTGNRIAGTWHSDLYIAGNTTTGSNDLYGWGQNMASMAGLTESVSSNNSTHDVYVPTLISNSTYTGTPLEVRGSSPTSSINVFGLRTTSKLYVFGDGIANITSWSSFGSLALTNGDVTSKLPTGVSLSDIASFRISSSAIALLTNSGNVYMLSKNSLNILGNKATSEATSSTATATSSGVKPNVVSTSTSFTIASKPTLAVGDPISLVNGSNSVSGTVNTYNVATGVLTINPISNNGSTTTSSWTVTYNYSNWWHKVTLSDGTTPLSGVTKLSISGSGAMALTASGNLYYWGDGNPYGSAGSPTAYNYAFDISSAVPAGTSISDILVAGKSNSNLFLLCADGYVYSCGTNDKGVLGINNSTTTTYTTTFSKVKKESDGSGVSTLNNIKKIDGGNNGDLDIVIAMNASGQIFGWGDNNQYGMLGTPKATGGGGSSNTDHYGAIQIFTSTTALYSKNIGGSASGTAASTAAPGAGYSDVSVGGHFIIAFYTSGSTSQYWYQGHNTNGSIGYDPDAVLQSGTTFGLQSDIASIYAPTYLNAPSGISFSCSNSVASITVGSVALTTLTTCSGSASPYTTFTVAGTGLTSSINVTAPTGYELSTASSGTYTSTLLLSATSGTVTSTTLYVRLSAGASNGASANIVCSSGSVSQSVATPVVTINSCSVSPTITTTGTTSAFTTCINTASTTQNFTVAGTDLTADLTITAPTGFQIATTSGGTYSNTLIVAASSGTVSTTTIWVRLTGVTSGTFTGSVDVSSTGATTKSVSVSGTVNTATVVGTITGGDVVVCSGTNNTTLSLVGSTGTIQWKSSTDNSTYTNITGATSATYTATNLNATTYYKAAVTSGSCSASLSAPATITVIPASVAGTISGATSVCTGTNNTVLTLVGSTGTIQWQSSIDNSTFTDITGATSATYTATDLTATTYYKAVVTSGACSAATTTAKTITVSPVSVAGTISGGNVSVCSGSDNSTTLTLTGYTGTIQWQSSSDNVTFANITGATNASYTANNVTSNTYYRAVVISGVCSSDMATAVLITSAPCIVANPDINATNLNTPVIGSINTNDKTTTGTTYGTPVPSSSNPIGGTIQLNSDGTYTFTATNVGKYIYYITVCAAGQTTGCAVSTLEISVTDPNSTNNPPLAKNDYATLQVNTPVSVKVLSNDKVANSNTTLLPSSITVATAPTNGSAAVNTTTGVITFTPNTGFTGTDSLKYNVCDNASPSNCQVATVYLKVSSSSVPEYTTADDDFNTVNMNSSVTGNVLTNDVNSANNTLTVTSNSTPLSTQGTIVMNADGSYTFTPVANFYGPVDVTYTACTAGSVCATATLHILVSPVKPAAPKANGGTYTSKDPSNPATISSTVTNVPAGSKVIYCDVNGLSCANTAPTLPTTPGIYIWCVKSLDTITNLTSSPCVYDTITVLPYVKVVNATYVNGVATNPKNISGLVTEISAGSIVKWCNVSGTICSTIAPALPTLVGKSIWCVKAVDTASGLSSLVCKMDTVTILDPYTVLEITKVAKSVKLNPDGTILATFVMNATNKTDAVLDSVSIKDDLTRTFNVSSGIVVSSLDVYGGLVKNTGYDGIANIDLVTSASKVAAQKTDSVVLKVLIESTDVSGNLTNIATLAGKSKYGKLSVLSNDPLANPSDSTRRVATGFVVPKVDIVIAGGFSPNQDGMNDKWIIIRPYGTTIHVKVFNRWGNIVYENEDYNNDWDGRGQGNFIGNYVPDGTYFYMVEAIDANGNVQKFTKSLTIVR